MHLDLNCDLGEGEPPARTRALMRWITSANVACGGHAGSLATMESCVRRTRDTGIRLGAHPGTNDRTGFGRVAVVPSPAELELLLIQQVSALHAVARHHHVPLHHIKLHGALYHAVDQDANLARTYLQLVRRFWPRVKIYARHGGTVARLGPSCGVVVCPEGFLDRAYNDDGTLVPRTEPGAVLTDLRIVRERLRTLLDEGWLVTRSGKHIPWHPRTLCIHADTPGALSLARVASAFSAT